MNLVEKVRAKARQRRTTIVLPEGDEPRTVAAAEIVRHEGLAEPVLLIPDIMSEKAEAYAEALYELRKAKGLMVLGVKRGEKVALWATNVPH